MSGVNHRPRANLHGANGNEKEFALNNNGDIGALGRNWIEGNGGFPSPSNIPTSDLLFIRDPNKGQLEFNCNQANRQNNNN